MISFIFIWTILLILCCTIGTGLLHFLQATAFQRLGDRLIASIWLGIIVLAVTFLLVSLVLPLSSLVGVAIAAGLCGLALLNRAVRTELSALQAAISPNIGLLYLLAAILIAVLSTRAVTWLDTGLYHYPLIHWFNQIGTVPGIALLFANFGFTSSWFAFAAPLNPEWLDARASATTGGFVLLMALLQSGIGLGSAFSGQARLSDWFLGFCSALLLICFVGSSHLREISISPSPDIPVALLTGVVPWAILVVTNAVPIQSTLPSSAQFTNSSLQSASASPDAVDSSLVPFILAIGSVTIKLVALPLLAVSAAFYCIHNRHSLKRLMDGLSTFILLFTPFLIVQILTSGCPLFPSSFLCLDLPWSVPLETKEWVSRLTHDWTNWYTSSTATGISLPMALWRWLSDNRGNQIMALIGAGSIVAIGFLVRVLRRSSVRGYFWVIATQIVGMAFYLKTSPLLRFALPSLILIPVLLASAYCYTRLGQDRRFGQDRRLGQASANPALTRNGLSNWTKHRLSPVLLGIVGVATILSVSVASSRLVLPPPLRSAPITQKQMNNVTYFSPEEPEVCWGADLPCAFEVPTDVYLRDPAGGAAEGFVRQR